MQSTGQDLPSSGRVLVAASGGVDSTMAALLLKKNGLEVIGVTFRLLPESHSAFPSEGPCPSESLIALAAQMCGRLGISHHVLDVEEPFREHVVKPFRCEYDRGRTPNPCVWCNPRVKWESLRKAAASIGCLFVATGHYARIDRLEGRNRLLRGTDPGKDQSYALYRLPQESLRNTLFPLGRMHKEDVRKMARSEGLAIWNRQESQDICFLPSGRLQEYIERHASPAPGPICDMAGNVLGMHRGLPLYTIGQRKGIGIACGKPIYVIHKDLGTNTIFVGQREDLCRLSFSVEDVHWVSREPPSEGAPLAVQVEVRYRSTPVEGEILVQRDQSVRVRLSRHDQSIAPGQSAVWYQGDVLLGGGIISGAG